MNRSPFASPLLRASFRARSLVVALACVAFGGCGSGDDASAQCGHTSATRDLSVVFKNYDDVGGETSCAEVDIDVFAGPSSEAPSATGVVPVPSGTPIASARSTLGASAEFALPPGKYVACARFELETCGPVELNGKRVYGTFTGGPAIEWQTSEDPAAN